MHASEILDFLSHDGDAAFIGGVQFEHARFDKVGTVKLFGQSEDGGGFACSWGPVEEPVMY